MLHLFLLGFALAVSPGPDFSLIVRNTVGSGRMIGCMTVLGNRLGFCIHISLAITGLSAILQTSTTLFLVIRAAGAAYLIYLGIRKLSAPFKRTLASAGASEGSAVGALEAVRQGFLNNLLNPKVSLFFLSLFPQVASPELLASSPWEVALVLFAGNTLWWIPLVLVLGSSHVHGILRKFQSILDFAFGVIFVGCGLRILKDEVWAKATGG